jgi:hypothetical protein
MLKTGWVIGVAFLVSGVVGGWGEGRASAEPERNACGCYQGESGTCYCDRKAKCGCPGACEPIGCEAQRQKALDKEIQEELRKAEGAGHGHEAGEPHDKKQPKAEEGAAEAPRPKKVNAATTKAPRLTATQRLELRRLLDLYLSEHPADATKTVGQLRGDVTQGDTAK